MSTPLADSLIVLLHGVGSRGSDIAGLAEAWRPSFPTTAFAAPDAPHPSSFGAGYQWFSVAGVTEDNRPGRVAVARAAFDATLTALLEEHDFADRLERVCLVGFSQGTIMALDALASGRWPIAGVLGYSGRLASPEPLQPSADTALLLVHGDADPVMPASLMDAAAGTLRSHGVGVETHMLAGLGHSISGKGVELGAAFLKRVLDR